MSEHNLDQFGLPTPQEVAVALRSDLFDTKLCVGEGQLETPSLLALYPRPFNADLKYRFLKHRPIDASEFVDIADLYAAGARHGWAWWELAHGVTPKYIEPRGIWYVASPAEKIMCFSSSALEFELETKRYGETDGQVDHDVTMPAPISQVADHFSRNLGWPPKAVLDLLGMYVTAFRHGWYQAAKADERAQAEKTTEEVG